jgi:hypothetical protein
MIHESKQGGPVSYRDKSTIDEVGSKIEIPTNTLPKGYLTEMLNEKAIIDWMAKLDQFDLKDLKAKNRVEGVNWFGTLWNRPDLFENPLLFQDGLNKLGYVDFHAFQVEEGEINEGVHIQFCMHLSEKKTFSKLMNDFYERTGLEIQMSWLKPMYAKSTPMACFNYCTKNRTRIAGPFIYGMVPKKQGERTDAKNFRTSIKENGITEEIKCSIEYMKYRNFALEARDDGRQERQNEESAIWFSENPLTELQEYIRDLVLHQNNRKILWVYNDFGSCGKSMLGKFLKLFHGGFIFNTGKTADIFEAYDYEDIAVIDLPRKSTDVNYNLIENFKDGYINKTKYFSRFSNRNPLQVVVFSNEYPDKQRFTVDRWDILTVSENGDVDLEEAPELDFKRKFNIINKKIFI